MDEFHLYYINCDFIAFDGRKIRKFPDFQILFIRLINNYRKTPISSGCIFDTG